MYVHSAQYQAHKQLESFPRSADFTHNLGSYIQTYTCGKCIFIIHTGRGYRQKNCK